MASLIWTDEDYRTYHQLPTSFQYVYHATEDDAIKFANKYADSFICMHRFTHKRTWKELYPKRPKPSHKLIAKKLESRI